MKKLLPQLFHVTEAGVIGNETPAFFARENRYIDLTPCFIGLGKSWHGTCYMFGTRTITSNAQDNKNKTNRLTHNKNKTARGAAN
ncbi:hypothetical protein V5O39_29495 [Pseudomonas parakoreensis]